MSMKETLARWLDWLRGATAPDDGQLAHVYSDGRQLWAANGHALHALELPLEKRGRVTLDSDDGIQVEEQAEIPPFAAALPAGGPAATIVVSAAALKRAAAGHEGVVRLAIHPDHGGLVLAGAGTYALLMPALGVDEGLFWRPEKGKDASLALRREEGS